VQVRLSQTIPSTILVIAREPLIQTLMCSLVDLAGHRAAQPRSDETVAAAIARVRPRLLLLDCEHDGACEDEAYQAAARGPARAAIDGASDPASRVLRDAAVDASRLI
jgi:hypothetical protein